MFCRFLTGPNPVCVHSKHQLVESAWLAYLVELAIKRDQSLGSLFGESVALLERALQLAKAG
jgi:hypothetical protein